MALEIKELKISFYRKGVINDIKQFKLHVERIESRLEDETKELKKYHENQTKKLSDTEKEKYYEFYTDDYWQLDEIFPNIQRKSELIGIYTLLEHNLNLLCSIYQKHSDFKLKISDLKAYGIIDTAKKYLSKVVELNFPSNHHSWGEIKKIQKIRNLFVHNNGKLRGTDDEKEKLKQYINNSDYLELNQYDRIIIKQGFTEYCLNQFKEFFEELCNSVDEHEK